MDFAPADAAGAPFLHTVLCNDQATLLGAYIREMVMQLPYCNLLRGSAGMSAAYRTGDCSTSSRCVWREPPKALMRRCDSRNRGHAAIYRNTACLPLPRTTQRTMVRACACAASHACTSCCMGPNSNITCRLWWVGPRSSPAAAAAGGSRR